MIYPLESKEILDDAKIWIDNLFDSWELEFELEYRGRWADDGGNLNGED